MEVKKIKQRLQYLHPLGRLDSKWFIWSGVCGCGRIGRGRRRTHFRPRERHLHRQWQENHGILIFWTTLYSLFGPPRYHLV